MSASAAASRPLSTASFTVVRMAFVAESYRRICLFRSKNSEMEISRCFFASSSAIDIDGTLSHPFGRDNRRAGFKHTVLQLRSRHGLSASVISPPSSRYGGEVPETAGRRSPPAPTPSGAAPLRAPPPPRARGGVGEPRGAPGPDRGGELARGGVQAGPRQGDPRRQQPNAR